MNTNDAEDEFHLLEAEAANAMRHLVALMNEFNLDSETQVKMLHLYSQGMEANRKMAVAALLMGLAGQSPVQSRVYIEKEVRTRNLGRIGRE